MLLVGEYEITVSSRARTVRVCVHPGGTVCVTVPKRASQTTIDQFLAKYSDWINRAREKAHDAIVITAEKGKIALYKKRAQRIVNNRIAHFSARYGVHHGSVTVRAQKSRWGSCSRKGNLSINYKVALLPAALQDYIIVHEVCHLAQFDHSSAFWDLVAREIPNHRALRRALRRTHFRFT